MSTEDELNAALVDAYQRSGEEVGYWGTRYIQALRRNGALATARRMLKPRNAGQRKGLDALLEAGRPDLTLEAIILQAQFRSLFTNDELAVAAERLGEYGKTMGVLRAKRERLYPDDLEAGHKYIEGAKRTVRVNAYERDTKARKKCIARYGTTCVVCGFNFETKYGAVGKDFIHVHHLNPIALSNGEYELDPIRDLRPVCPNCHAMLHRPEKLMSIIELRAVLKNGGQMLDRSGD